MSTSTWINFKELRANLNFADVLKTYGVELKSKGTQHHGFCPLPNHNGKRNSPSFSANLEKGIFNCFGCGAKGNALEFAALMEGVSPQNGAELRKVAIKLRDKFCPQLGSSPKENEKRPDHTEAEQFDLPHTANQSGKPNVVVNAPLNFELKQLDTKHPYLDKRGFTAETIERFGLGYCSKGLFAGRIAIPIHNTDSKLVGYCGRLVDDKAISEENPRYKFPPKREHKGVTYEFQKLKLLYNSHRLTSPVQDLAIVEGFASVWWLNQMGFPNVVALMGWTMSEEQAGVVVKLVPATGRVWVLPDGDESGGRCAASVLEHIAPARSVRLVKLDEGKQPTDYPGGFYKTWFEK